MNQQLHMRGLAYERISAVDARAWGPELEAYQNNEHRSHLSQGEIACMLSHFKVWETFLQSEATFALVLEDDLHVQDDISSFIDEMTKTLNPNEIAVNKLEAYNARITLSRKPKHVIGKRSSHQLHSNIGGTGAYVLNRKTAERFAAHKQTARHAIDIELFDQIRQTITGHDLYQWLPSPFIQDVMVEDQQGLGSHLHGTRADQNMGIFQSTDSIEYKLRSLVRPVYTALYDLSLRPKQKMRRDAKFG